MVGFLLVELPVLGSEMLLIFWGDTSVFFYSKCVMAIKVIGT